MPIAPELTHLELAQYRKTARNRHEYEQKQLALRKERAWELARQAAVLLRTQYQADRIFVFGSLVQRQGFSHWSDVDIAAWGIAASDTFRAIGAVMDLSDEMEINLVDIDTCSSSLRTTILEEGIAI